MSSTTILALLALARTISADDGTISSASSVSTDVTAVPTAQCASTLSTCDEFVEIDALPYLNSDEQLTVQTHYDDTYGCEMDVVSTLRNCWICEDIPTSLPVPAPTPTLPPTTHPIVLLAQ